jgi:inorganic phosphate transporter, PiT family
MLTILISLAVILLAYSNGANDNFKGTATLWGSGTLTYKKAVILATTATAAGSLASFFFASSLVKNFSGKGLVPDAVVGSPMFILAVALGAGLTVLAATKIGFPISTTHGLVGALVGAGYIAAAGAVDISKLGKTFFTPLVLSPILAVAVSALLYFVFKQIRKSLKINQEEIIFPNGQTKEEYVGEVMSINAQQVVNGLHYVSAATVCFARALNDTPKMAGLLIVASLFAPSVNILILAAAMALGGILSARKVAETMSQKITKLNHGQGFSANLTTSILVILASTQGLPVSTTHVSVGSLVGIGLVNGKADLSQIGKIVLSWLLTLPIAAGLAALAYSIIQNLT